MTGSLRTRIRDCDWLSSSVVFCWEVVICLLAAIGFSALHQWIACAWPPVMLIWIGVARREHQGRLKAHAAFLRAMASRERVS